ncbi:MAG: hypothetical protein OXN97_14960 [Bryobacterales bacterium]|nr:hypothetical protein [Bryobacterales bacterium]
MANIAEDTFKVGITVKRARRESNALRLDREQMGAEALALDDRLPFFA